MHCHRDRGCRASRAVVCGKGFGCRWRSLPPTFPTDVPRVPDHSSVWRWDRERGWCCAHAFGGCPRSCSTTMTVERVPIGNTWPRRQCEHVLRNRRIIDMSSTLPSTRGASIRLAGTHEDVSRGCRLARRHVPHPARILRLQDPLHYFGARPSRSPPALSVSGAWVDPDFGRGGLYLLADSQATVPCDGEAQGEYSARPRLNLLVSTAVFTSRHTSSRAAGNADTIFVTHANDRPLPIVAVPLQSAHVLLQS